MNAQTIERADELPLVLYWLLNMRVDQIIDTILPYPHLNRQGLSYGQLAVLFIAFVIYTHRHRLCEMEEWVEKHQVVLMQATGWWIQDKDATDDRLSDLLSALGEDEERGILMQRQLGQHLVQAYALPTEVGRYDTTTFTVHHVPGENGQAAGGVLSFGHSKDHRPDLLQFKQGLGTLDPAGVPLFTHTVGGQAADDPLYLPAWQEMCTTIGHTQFLFVADCKAAALQTRAEIDAGGGFYLFPMPMTGEVPAQLRTWVLDPPMMPEPLVLEGCDTPDGQPVVIGCGFVVERTVSNSLENGQTHTWTERWLVTRSDALATRHQHGLEERLKKAEAELERLNARSWVSAEELEQAAQRVLEKRCVDHWVTRQVQKRVLHQTRYRGPGRPGPNRQMRRVETEQFHLLLTRNQVALDQERQLAGWRIYVTNQPSRQMSLNQATAYYRDEFLVERGFHRFKRGSIPVLPLFLRLPERIRGLMLLLLIVLQALTLIEFVAQRELARRQETLDGLAPGNPKMKTAHPSAERMLARFSELHLIVEQTETQITGRVTESLSPVQRRILALLGVPETIYTAHFCQPVHYSFNSS
jgi:transposase